MAMPIIICQYTLIRMVVETTGIVMAIKDLELNQVPQDDGERLELIKQNISESIDINIIESKLKPSSY